MNEKNPMSRRMNDGVITGKVDMTRLIACARCGEDEVAVHITEVTLPDGVKPGDKRIIAQRGENLGITCGCYAKAHRQFAHIRHRFETR